MSFFNDKLSGLISGLTVGSEAVEIGLNERLEVQKNQGITALNLENQEVFDPVGLILSGVGLGCVGFATYGTFYGQMGVIRACTWYLLGGAILLHIDPINAITPVLAKQSRTLIAISCIVSAIVINFNLDLTRAAGLFVYWGIVSCMIKILNGRWIRQSNWTMSQEVQKAIICYEESKGVIAWNDYGKRESRVVLAESGLAYDENTLESYGKSLFVLGYYNGYRVTTELEHKAENLQNKTDKLKAQYEEQSEELERLKANLKDSLTRMRESEEHARAVSCINDKLREEYNEVVKENEYLHGQNEYLLQFADGTHKFKSDQEKEKYIESQIVQLLTNTELGERPIAEKVGVSRNKVRQIKEKHNLRKGTAA